MPKYVPRERKHRRRTKEENGHAEASVDDHNGANAEVILPASATEKEARRRALQVELRAQQSQEKITSKKRKRLDHYIETKLKRDENAELIKKLAGHKIDTDLLQSSKRLGQAIETKQEAFRRALREKDAGVDVLGDQDEILYQRRRDTTQSELLSTDFSDVDEQHSKDDEDTVAEEVLTTLQGPGESAVLAFGSGLKRPLDDEDGQPIVKRRKRRKKSKHEKEQIIHNDSEDDDDNDATNDDENSEWGGFDDSNAEEDMALDTGSALEPNEVESDTSEDVSELEDSQNTNDEEIQEDSDTSSEDESTIDRPARASAFKQWAETQRNDALGFTPSLPPTNDAAIKANFKPRQPSPDAVANVLQGPDGSQLARPMNALVITRSEEVQSVRMSLPVVQEEQRIMEAIHNNPVVIVCGATGSGKTTQVPQMLFESGYGSHVGRSDNSASLQNRGMIGVTQPRRVAAVSVADRVATELGDDYKARVAHQVRYDTTASKQTAIKFMTDGILLREINADFVLSKYSAIVIDEAHERSVNTDILIGTLSRIVNLRDELTKEQPAEHYPLKLIIMSATLRVTDFAQNQRLFRGLTPPIVEAEGRQYPVTIHFARRTERDYVTDIVKKVSRGHKKLPAGAMLVFLTGQNEILTAAKMLQKALGDSAAGSSYAVKARDSSDQVPLETDDFDVAMTKDDGGAEDDSDAEFDGLDDEDDDGDFDLGEPADEQDSAPKLGVAHSHQAHILPLYAALPTSQQMRIFQPPPAGSRLIVLATNVAETSLTIPGIRYVFDCGRSKEKKYDRDTGVQTFEIDWISKASAAQRTGRAGRTGPGHCWRLYSSAIYEEFFAEHSSPEILRTPIEGTILQLKAMNIDNVVNFPFPTPPDRSQLQTGETLLRNLGAIDGAGKITPHGRALMQYPVSPRYSKMLQIATSNGILEHTIALVAGLAVGDLYIPELQTTDVVDANPDDSDDDDKVARARRAMSSIASTEAQKRHQAYTRAQAILGRWDDRSDSIKLLTAVAAHADAVASDQEGGPRISQDLYLREKGMSEVQQLRQQLHAIIRSQHRHTSLPAFKLALTLANEVQRKMLNQVVAAGFLDQIAIRADLLPTTEPTKMRKPRSAIEVPYRPLMPLEAVNNTTTLDEQEDQRCIYVHPSSVLARLSKTEMPSYIVYSHLSRAASKVIGDAARTPRTRMHPLTTISAKALAALAQDTPLLELGKPIGKIEDKGGGKGRVCWIAVSMKPTTQTSGIEWPLGAWKVEQTRDRKGQWKMVKVLAR